MRCPQCKRIIKHKEGNVVFSTKIGFNCPHCGTYIKGIKQNTDILDKIELEPTDTETMVIIKLIKKVHEIVDIINERLEE